MKIILKSILFLLMAIFGTACHSADKPLPAGISRQSILVQGTQRYYLFRAPTANKPVNGVVMLFHGHTGSAEHLLGMKRIASPYVRWLDIAQRENLILIVPQGAIGGDGKSGWADCRLADSGPVTDDLAFIDAILQTVQRKYRVDTKRLYALGTSNGGHFVLRLAHERHGLLAAAGVVIAAEAAESRCAAPKQALPILFMNGTEDPLLKWHGGQVGKGKHKRGKTQSVMDTVNYWVNINHAETKAKIENLPDIRKDDKSRVVLHRYAAKENGKPVVLYEVIGGGHTEPSIDIEYSNILSLMVGRQNRDIEMADTVWHFFREQ